MSKPFKLNYIVDDGYCGHRPQYANIDIGELEPEMTEEELRTYYQETMQSSFEQKIIPVGQNEDEFVEWAKAHISEMEE